MSSDESDFDNEENIGQGYQYEPEYTEEELTANDRKINLSPEPNERSLDLTWCTCNKCTIMSTFKECNCCQEFEYYSDQFLSDSIPCITNHEDFDLICLNSTVLETAFVGFLRYKRQTGRAPDSLSSKQSRLMAYRQFVNWVRRGQPLGRKFRIVLPSCVVSKIRQTFPDPDNNYEGFHNASSSESDSD